LDSFVEEAVMAVDVADVGVLAVCLVWGVMRGSIGGERWAEGAGPSARAGDMPWGRLKNCYLISLRNKS
jgi:hypothetical protein